MTSVITVQGGQGLVLAADTASAMLHIALEKRLAKKGLQVSLWSGGTPKSNPPHLLEVSTLPKSTILYVKYSSSPRGFWGLTKNQLGRLGTASVRWFAVLLLRKPDAGYVLTGGQVNLRIQDGTFKLAGDGDYKINEGDLVREQAFSNLDALVSRVF